MKGFQADLAVADLKKDEAKAAHKERRKRAKVRRKAGGPFWDWWKKTKQDRKEKP